MNPIKKSFQYGRHTVTLETGEIARQASGAVLVRMDDTVVLVSVVVAKDVKPGQDFFPLTVEYQERTYAAGKIPGGFFKREGKPSEQSVLTCRLIDRPMRPLFPEGFYNDVQVIATVLSVDPEIDSDIPALIGASAAMTLSGAPFDGPIAATRVGYIDGQYVLNPSRTELKTTSQLDLVVAGTESAVLMVESEASGLSEEIMLGAVVYGHEQMQVAIDAILELADEAGVSPFEWTAPAQDDALISRIRELAEEGLQAAYRLKQKQARSQAIDEVKAQVLPQVIFEGDSNARVNQVKGIFKDLEAQIVRGQILNGEPRIDGRDTRTVRPITIRAGLLPRAHGSVLFTRGETQALVVTTLGTKQDEQTIDALHGEYSERFMLHYNFPPYSTGETGRVGVPKRREIGHGNLAKRALRAVLPAEGEFGYSMRVVSEITESNGSSSMASVCGGCLSLMDAGVPLKDHVAGVAMGLIKDGNRFAVLTDILGDEDHLGDMDFKVAGTESGVTALQMDIKINGITKEIMRVALDQAKAGRLHILGIMKNTLGGAREELSAHAPRMISFRINPDKIREVIGKGGSVIRALTEETGTSIDISDEGVITIASVNMDGAEEAKRRILGIAAEVEVGAVYEGKVTRLMEKNGKLYGALVEVMSGKEGLLHISQVAHERVANLTDYLNLGDVVKVKVLEVDGTGRISLSIKAMLPQSEVSSTEA